MKKWIKVFIGIMCVVILIFVIDLICIFTINRPLFAFKAKTRFKYNGIIYDVYNCPEYSTPQIKGKNAKFSCAVEIKPLKIKEMVDTTKNKIGFSCAEALQSFYSDDKYTYYWNCMKNNYMIVRYEGGYEETIKEALENGTIKISDLDKYNINYIKYEME